MPFRVCVYKGCDNYIRDSTPCGNKQFTLFRFPKDVGRFKQWLKNGAVPEVIPETRLLMCSEHFEQKYLVKNARRTMLTTTAVPIPYSEKCTEKIHSLEHEEISFEKSVEGSETVKFTDTLDGEMIFSIQGDLNDGSTFFRLKECISNDNNEEDDNGGADGILEPHKDYNNSEAEYCVESTSIAKDTDMELGETEETYAEVHYEDELLTDVAQSMENDKTKLYTPKKRKIDSDNDDETPSSSKSIVSKTLLLNKDKSFGDSSEPTKRNAVGLEYDENYVQTELHRKKHHSVSEEVDSETLVDKKWVTCFIYKGEEYVQMPKEFYVQEKMELMKKLRKYESILQAFKKDLLDLDLS